ncbi:MAG: carboxypeptidase regulatory-like domain-containing protein [Fibrobacteria bacterium]|nr:carboxypeptidase regulatory-like domain-containing protein [Fibrobacteria bacterium]
MKKFELIVLSAIIALLMSCAQLTGDSEKEGEAGGDGTTTTVSGILVDKDGNPIQGATVSIVGDSATPDISKEDGSFSIGGVKPGNHTIYIYHADYKDTSQLEVEVSAGQKYEIKDSIQLVWNYHIIKGRAVSGNQALAATGVAIPRTMLNATTDGEGIFVFDKIPINYKSVKLMANHHRNGTGETVLTKLTQYDTTFLESDIEVETPGARVSGVVLDKYGEPISGITVQSAGGGSQDKTGPDGSYTLTNVPKGEKGVMIEVPEEENQGVTGAVMGFEADNTIMGMNIQLRDAPTLSNGMKLETVDQIVNEESNDVTLQVFPQTTDSIEIKQYDWKIKNGSSLGSTEIPELDVSLSQLQSGLSKRSADSKSGLRDVEVVVTAVNKDGDEASNTFSVQLRSPNPILLNVGGFSKGNEKPSDTITIIEDNWATMTFLPYDVFGGIDTIQWVWGDGDDWIAVDSGFTIAAHKYVDDGEYTAVIRLVDREGNLAKDSVHVIVKKSSLEQPKHVEPWNGYICLKDNETVKLKWDPVNGNAVSYNVYMDDRNYPPSDLLAKDITETEYEAVIDSGKTYFWMIEAVSGPESNTSGDIWKIQGKTNIEYKDFLVSPRQDSTLEVWTVKLSWKKENDAKYRVYTGYTPADMAPEGDGTFQSSYYYSCQDDETLCFYKSDLTGNKTYVWQVVMQDSTKKEFYSHIYAFHVPNHLPGKSSLKEPYASVLIEANTPVTYWWSQSSDQDEGDELDYILFVDKTENLPTTALAKLHDTTKFTDTVGYTESGTYKWRIGVTDGHDTVYSTPREFQVNSPPQFTTADTSMPSEIKPGVVYRDTIYANDPENYEDLRYANMAGALQVSFDQSTGDKAIFSITPRFSGDTIFAITVKDQHNLYDTLTWKVTVAEPEKDILVKPAKDTTLNPAYNNSFNFEWSTLPNFTYQLWLGEDTSSMDAVGDYTTYASKDAVLAKYTTYYWKMKIKDANDNITESVVWMVSVNLPDTTDMLVGPEHEAQIAAGTTAFQWKSFPSFEQTVFLGKGDTANMDSVYVTSTSSSTNRSTSQELTGNATYYWRVRIRDAQENITWSPTRSLTTNNRVPTVPSNLVTNNVSGLITTNTQVDFSWTASSDADGDSLKYIIQLDSNDNSPTTEFVADLAEASYSHTEGFAATTIYYWRVGASDGRDTTWSSTNEPSFYTNTAPELGTPKDTTLNINTAYRITLKATDTAASAMYYYKYGGSPSGVTIETDGAVSWTPGISDTGVHTVYAYVEDRHPKTTSAALRLRDSVSWSVTVASNGIWQAASPRSFNGADSDIPKIVYNGSTGYVALRTGTTGPVSVWFTTNDYDWEKLGGIDPTGSSSRNNTGLAVNGPHVYMLYQENASNDVIVMHWNGSIWDTLGNAIVANGYRSYGNQSIVVHNDTVYVGYVNNASPYQAYVKRFNGTTWETVATNVSSDPANIVRLASDGTDLFVAFRLSNNSFSVRKLNGSSWTTINGGSLTLPIEGVEIVAKSGTVYISYRTASTDAISVAKSVDGGSWTHLGAQDFTNSISSGNMGDLAVDAAGNVYIAYTVYPGYHVNVQKYAEGVWSYVGYPSLTSLLPNGGANSVRISLSGSTPYIAFDDRQSTYGVSVMKFVP